MNTPDVKMIDDIADYIIGDHIELMTENRTLRVTGEALLHALQMIDSNAAESPEWIRRVTREAIAKTAGVL